MWVSEGRVERQPAFNGDRHWEEESQKQVKGE